VWTYVYFSYSANQRRAVAFIKYADAPPIRTQIDATNPETTYLRFSLGGNDNQRYRPFNGQFTRVYYNDAPGTFADSTEQILSYLTSQGDRPSNQWDKTVNIPVVGAAQTITYNDQKPRTA